MAQSATRQNLIESVLSHVTLPTGISIRAWTDADCQTIRELLNSQGWATSVDIPKILTAWRQSWPTLIASSGETVVGFLRGITDGTMTTFIAELLVDPAWRGQGIGSALIETCHQLILSAELDMVSNPETEAMTEAEGFDCAQVFRKNYVKSASAG